MEKNSAATVPSSWRSAHVGRSIHRLWPWLGAAGSGLLLAWCYPPYDQGWLCWFALAPLLCALFFSGKPSRTPSWRCAALGYLCGLVFFSVAFGWLSSLGTLYANVWLSALPFGLALYMALYFAFWAWFVGALVPRADPEPRFASSLRNLRVAFLGASAWVAHEWVRGWLFSGFGWNDLGVALHHDLAMIQIVEFTGVPGLSFLVCFCNLMAVIVVRRIVGELGPRFLTRIRWEFSVTVAMIAAVFSFGVRTLLKPLATGPSETVQVCAIQPNIPQTEKFDRDSEANVLSQLERLTGLAALTQPPPDLVLWPEAATPRGMFADEESYRFVIEQAKRGDFALLIGTIDSDPQSGEDYNVAAFLTERGQRHELHRKMHLVPFGEYLPLRPIFSHIVGELVARDFSRGKEFTVLQLPSPRVKCSPLICFEDTLGDLTRQFVLGGAQLLVNITNDGWFLQTAANEQHLANAVFRAVENRRPLIRCANTGITCGVDPQGRVTRWLPAFEQGFASRTVVVPTSSALTFYSRHGDWLSCAAATITIFALFRRVRRSWVNGARK